MKSRVFDFINIDEYSSTPKYLQLANCIVYAVQLKKLKKDDSLPSINEMTYEFAISRSMVEKGYKYLRNIGIVTSTPGKGFYINNTETDQPYKVFLLFNKLSAHKKIIYDAITEALNSKAAIDSYVYNNDVRIFKRLIYSKLDEYTHYVIIPHFIQDEKLASSVVNMIPKEKLILLDKGIDGVTGQYAAVCENFEKDIYVALEQAHERLSKYKMLKIIFPDYSYYPKEILKGISAFCRQYKYPCKVVAEVSAEHIQPGDVFISLMEDDLVTLIEQVLGKKMKIGTDVGIISYNETPLKKFLLDGITTVSTDFKQIGQLCADCILNNKTEHFEVPFELYLRASL